MAKTNGNKRNKNRIHDYQLIADLRALLVQSSGVKNGVVAAGNEIMSDMSFIVDGESRPSIGVILTVCKVAGSRLDNGINTVVMATSTVDNVPRSSRVVESIGINGVVVNGVDTLVVVDMAEDSDINLVGHEELLESLLAVQALARLVGSDVPRSVTGNNNPRGLGTVNRLQVVLKPIILLVGVRAERSGVLITISLGLIRSDQSITQISFGVELNKVGHTIVERVPHVVLTTRLNIRHLEVVNVSGEVRLAGHANLRSVGNVVGLVSNLTVVTVGLVVTGSNHVRLVCTNVLHLVVELIEDSLINLNTLCNSGVREVSLDLLLEPVVGVCNVTRVPKELVLVQVVTERFNGVLLTLLQSTFSTLASGLTETKGSHGTKINNHSEREIVLVTDLRGGGKVVNVVVRVLASTRGSDLVVVNGIRLKARKLYVIVPGSGGLVSGTVTGCGELEQVRTLTVLDNGLLDVVVGIPTNGHTMLTSISDTVLNCSSRVNRDGLNLGDSRLSSREEQKSESKE